MPALEASRVSFATGPKKSGEPWDQSLIDHGHVKVENFRIEIDCSSYLLNGRALEIETCLDNRASVFLYVKFASLRSATDPFLSGCRAGFVPVAEKKP